MKKYFIVLIFSLLASGVEAFDCGAGSCNGFNGDFPDGEPLYTYTVYGEIPTIKAVFAEDHFLGGKITEKWNTFTANYTHTYDMSIGFTDSMTEIAKPAVYNAVLKVNKHYRKALRKGLITKEIASQEMAHVLDCANVVCFEGDTGDLEAALSKAANPQEIIAVFNQVRLIREY